MPTAKPMMRRLLSLESPEEDEPLRPLDTTLLELTCNPPRPEEELRPEERAFDADETLADEELELEVGGTTLPSTETDPRRIELKVTASILVESICMIVRS